MQRNRIANHLLSTDNREFATPPTNSEAPRHPTSIGFVVCPAGLMPGNPAAFAIWQQAVYALAAQQAQAATRPSILELAQAVSPN